MILAPGLLRYLICMYQSGGCRADQTRAVKILRSGWMMPRRAAVQLLSGQVPHRIDGETVKFTV
jgi:hypothetical protein